MVKLSELAIWSYSWLWAIYLYTLRTSDFRSLRLSGRGRGQARARPSSAYRLPLKASCSARERCSAFGVRREQWRREKARGGGESSPSEVRADPWVRNEAHAHQRDRPNTHEKNWSRVGKLMEALSVRLQTHEEPCSIALLPTPQWRKRTFAGRLVYSLVQLGLTPQIPTRDNFSIVFASSHADMTLYFCRT